MPGDTTLKPGPGAYKPENVYYDKKIAPKFSFGIRHSQYSGTLITQDDMAVWDPNRSETRSTTRSLAVHTRREEAPEPNVRTISLRSFALGTPHFFSACVDALPPACYWQLSLLNTLILTSDSPATALWICRRHSTQLWQHTYSYTQHTLGAKQHTSTSARRSSPLVAFVATHLSSFGHSIINKYKSLFRSNF